MSTPAVSVLMSVYNGGKYIAQCLDSLLQQTFRDFELVVIDDASTDDTPTVLGRFTQRDARVRVQRNERNLKLAAALNVGLRLCRAPLIARADADDWYVPTRLHDQASYLERNPDVGVVSSAFHCVDEPGNMLGLAANPSEDEKIKLHLLWESCICHAACVFRKELVLSVGGYDETYWTAQDYDLWARLKDRTRFGNLATPLMFVRANPASISATKGKAGMAIANRVSQRLLAEYLNRPISIEETAAFRNLLCVFTPLQDTEYQSAFCTLSEVMSKSRKAEPPAVVDWFRREIARSLLHHSLHLTYRRPATGSRILARALLTDLSQIARTETWKQIMRYSLKVPVVGLKRAVQRSNW